VVALVVAAGVTLAVLYLVPFPVQVTVREQLTSPATSPSGCGSNAGGLDLAAGHAIHLSWQTAPSEVVGLLIAPLAGGTAVFNASGASGSGTFSSNAASYVVFVTNCGRTTTTVTVTASYNSDAPLI